MSTQSTTSWTSLFGPTMIAAPTLLVASSVACAIGGGIDNDEVGGVLQVYASALFALVVIGLATATGDRFRRASMWLTVTGMIGAVGGDGFGIVNINSALTGFHLQDSDAASVQLGLLIPGLLFPITLVGFGVALITMRAKPALTGFALVAGAVLFPISRIGSIEALAVVADVVLAAALIPFGLALMSRRAGVADVAVSVA